MASESRKGFDQQRLDLPACCLTKNVAEVFQTLVDAHGSDDTSVSLYHSTLFCRSIHQLFGHDTSLLTHSAQSALVISKNRYSIMLGTRRARVSGTIFRMNSAPLVMNVSSTLDAGIIFFRPPSTLGHRRTSSCSADSPAPVVALPLGSTARKLSFPVATKVGAQLESQPCRQLKTSPPRAHGYIACSPAALRASWS